MMHEASTSTMVYSNWVNSEDYGRMSQDGMKSMARKSTPKRFYKNPDKYFTPEVMEKLDVIAQGTYSYGS